MDQHEIEKLLVEARRAEARGDPATAARHYAALLQQEGTPRELGDLLEAVRGKQEIAEQIAALVRQGNGAIERREFDEAISCFQKARDLAHTSVVRAGYGEVIRGLALARVLRESRDNARRLLRQVREDLPTARVERLGTFEHQLEALPDLPAAQATRDALRQGRDEIERFQFDDRARLDRALAASKTSNFRLARRLLDAITPGSSLHQSAELQLGHLRKALDESIEPALAAAEEAISNRQWDRAREEIDKLWFAYRPEPSVQRCLARINYEEAAEQVDNAEEALIQRDPNTARTACANAQQRIAYLVRRDPPYPAARGLDERANDLAAITADVERVLMSLDSSDLSTDSRNRAVFALNSAIARTERAADEGRPYPFVSAALACWRDEVVGEIGRIVGDAQQLREATRLIEAGHLERAEPLVTLLGRALRPQDRASAAALSSTLAARQTAFTEAMAQGASQEGEDPEGAVATYAEAYRLWPSGPEVALALERALVRAGEAALAARDEPRALPFFERALALNPDNQAARAGVGRPQLRERLQSALAALSAELNTLDQGLDTLPEAYDPLAERVRLIIADAAELEDVRTPASALAVRLGATQAGRQRFVTRRAAASERRLRGDWPAAARLLREAAAQLAPAPSAVTAELARWEGVATAMTANEAMAASLLAEARLSYDTVLEAEDLDASKGSLNRLSRCVEAAIERASQAGGEISPALRQSYDQARELERRVAAAYEVMLLPSPQLALSATDNLVSTLGTDPLLTRLRERFADALRRRAAELVSAADLAFDEDRLDDTVRLLQEARALDPATPGVAERFARLEARQRLEAVLHAASEEASTSTTTVTSARDALQRALVQVLEANEHIPLALQGDLKALLDLGFGGSRSDLYRPETWAEALRLRDAVLGHRHWVARVLATPLALWLNYARDAAAYGVIATLGELGQALNAYREAYEYRQANPDSEAALGFLGQARQVLRVTLSDFATKQLSRANELLDRGEPGVAQEHVNRLFAEYYEPIQAQYSGLLEQMDEQDDLLRQRDEATLLRARTAQLVAKAHAAEQILSQARDLYVQNRYSDVSQLLLSLPDLTELPQQRLARDRLAQQNAQARSALAESSFGSRLSALEAELQAVTTNQAFAALRERIEQQRSSEEWLLLGEQVRARYEELWSRSFERGSRMASLEAALASARSARDAGDLAHADAQFRLALDLAVQLDDPLARAGIEREQRATEELGKAQAQFRELLARGEALLDLGAYPRAGESFTEARANLSRLPASPGWEERLRLGQSAAMAGLHLSEARIVWESGVNLRRGLDKIELARAQLQQPERFRTLNEEISYYEARLRERYALLRAELDAAQQSIQYGELSVARRHVQAALAIDSGAQAAHALEAQIEALERSRSQQSQLAQFLRQAQQERRRGNGERALDLVRRMLELDPQHEVAQSLRIEVEANLHTSQQYRDVQQQIFKGKFSLARRRLAEATDSLNDEQIGDLRRMLDEQEASYRSATFTPIRDMSRMGRFVEALRRVNEELSVERDAPPLEREYFSASTREELEQLRQTVAEQALSWVEVLHSRAVETGLPDPYVLAVEKVHELLAEPDLPMRERFERLLAELRARELEARLDLVDLALKTLGGGESDPAQARRQAAAPRTVETARYEAELVAKAAESQAAPEPGTSPIARRARELIAAANELLQAQSDRRAVARMDNLLSRPRQSLLAAREQRDAAAASRLLRQTRQELDRIRLDAQGERLLARPAAAASFDSLELELKGAEELARRSEEAITGTTQALKHGQLDLAQIRLGAPPVWPPLEADHGRLRTIVAQLKRAARSQARTPPRWAEALAAYAAAFALDSELNLAEAYEPEHERCREGYTTSLLAQVEHDLLAGAEPATCAKLLADEEERGWLAAAAAPQIATLRQRMVARQALAQARGGLADPSRPAAALALLKVAHDADGDPAFQEELASWEQLALALEALGTADYERALACLARLGPALGDQPIARQLRGDLHAKLLVEAHTALQAYEPDRAERLLERAISLAVPDRRLDQLRVMLAGQRSTLQEVEAALAEASQHVAGGQWPEAAQRLDNARRLAPGYWPAEALAAELLGRLEAIIDEAAEGGDYATLRQLAAYAGRIGPSARVAQIVQTSEARRHELLARELADFEQDLVAGGLGPAEDRLETLARLSLNSDDLSRLKTRLGEQSRRHQAYSEAMEAGWRALARLADPAETPLALVTAARDAFTSEPVATLPEARRWAAYAAALAEALRLFEEVRDAPDHTAFQQLLELLGQAARQLQPIDGEVLPVLFRGPERLTGLRRRYAAFAEGLIRRVTGILKQQEESRLLEQQVLPGPYQRFYSSEIRAARARANEAIEKLEAMIKEFAAALHELDGQA